MLNKKEPLSIIATKIFLAVLLLAGIGTIIVGGGWLVGKQGKVQNPVIKTGGLEILVDGNLKTVSNIQLPIDAAEAEKIVKEFCEPKNPNYKYDYRSIKKVNNEWRIPITNLNCPCYATVNIGTGEANCMKQIPFGTAKEVTITTDKTEYEQGEMVKINVKNNQDVDICYFTYQGSDCYKTPYSVHRLFGKEWKLLRTGNQETFCIQTVLPPACKQLIKSNKSVEFVWNQKTLDKDQMLPGRYKISIDPGLGTIYSNEFTIKEKVKDETADWKTYRNEKYGFEMKYPKGFFTEQVLQPKTKAAQCDYANFINNCPAKITINGMSFCSQKTSEGAAGTDYETYNYTTVRGTECFVVSFTVTYPNCSNFLPAANQEVQEAYDKCMLDNEVTKPKIINQILSSFKFTEK